MRKRFVYLLLLGLKAFSRIFYRFEWHWVGTQPPGLRWQPFRLVAMVVILPEGRMKRADGKDARGKEMTVRGGIADIIETFGDGKMLLAYSEGLHHIQVPGQKLPNLFRTIRLRLESIDLADYRAALASGKQTFRKSVIRDLTARRDRYCSPDFDTSKALAELDGRRRTPGA